MDVVAKSVAIGYGPRAVLEDLALALDGGSILAILGPSGSGKTTLVRAFAGLLPLSSGSIHVYGQSPEKARLNRDISLLFQHPVLLPWLSAAENIEFASQPRHRLLGRPLLDRSLELYGLLDRLRLSRATLDLQPRELSGGMAARVALAGAILARRRLLLLDEPFAALDEHVRRSCHQALLEYVTANRPACLIVTHSIGEALYLADTIIVLAAPDNRPAHVNLHVINSMKAILPEAADAVAYQASLKAILEAYG